MLNKQAKESLKRFQSEYTRSVEEEFAQVLSEREDLRLFFVNENRAYTDGKNIILDPAWNELFADTAALIQTEEYLGLDNMISSDRGTALRMVTRAQNIHETLHIIFSNFPGGIAADKRASTKVRATTLAMISNIIEDSFIEAAGCSEYDNMEPVLKWFRVAMCCSNIPSQGTIERAFSELPLGKAEEGNDPDGTENPEQALLEYLSYMGVWLLYPMAEPGGPGERISEYVGKTKELFLQGSACGNAGKRYTYTQKIFDVIEPLIPDVPDIDTKIMASILCGTGTHTGENASLEAFESKGRDAVITRKLFTGTDGTPSEEEEGKETVKAELVRLVNQFERDAKVSDSQFATPGGSTFVGAESFGAARLHNGIRIEIVRPELNMNLKKAYQNIYHENKLAINTYTYRFAQLLQAETDMQEGKQLFGSHIDSKRLGDVKNRYWSRRSRGVDVPDIAILLLIDGSGSMWGRLREGAMTAAVVLHEVLDKNGIPHAIVEHRAKYGEPLLEHKILVGFGYRKNDKYNILQLEADEGTREGLSLYWAERYLTQNTNAENRVILMISDGVPSHRTGEADYSPPISTKDTAIAAKRIDNRGTAVIAIALGENDYDDDNNYTFEQLKNIYPNVVSCTDTGKLPGQICSILSKLMDRY